MLDIDFISLRFLFLVCCLQSSQKTMESRELGSECSSKQPLHILWPHDKVSGKTKKFKQLRQLKLCSKGCRCCLFLSNISSIFSISLFVSFKDLVFSSKLVSYFLHFCYSKDSYSLIVFSNCYFLLSSVSLNSTFLL